jgi:hypothetical protein
MSVTQQAYRPDPLDDPANLVSFPRVEKFLSAIFEALDSEAKSRFEAERGLIEGFLQMFPAGFITHIPYPENQPGRYVFRIVSPPTRWP